jgi:hypothetical protein
VIAYISKLPQPYRSFLALPMLVALACLCVVALLPMAAVAGALRGVTESVIAGIDAFKKKVESAK